MLFKKIKVQVVVTLIIGLCLCNMVVATHANTSNRVSPLIQLSFSIETQIYGLTAWDSLGKNTGTLAEFAKHLPVADVVSYLLFPVNYFNAYNDEKEVFGGIISQGRLLHDDWFDFGCGFDKDNNFYLFSLVSYASNEPNDKIFVKDSNGNNVEIITAFNVQPWLIKNGVNLNILPTPGANADFLSSKRQRAFMGQTEDGTFMYGMVPNVSIYELQEICSELGLVNAINTDGGASCGAYQDGRYLAHPGRELASVICIVETVRPPLSDVTVQYNGNIINFTQPPTERHGFVFYPLEDVVQAFYGGHGWDAETFTVSGELNGNKVEIPLNDLSYWVNGSRLDVPVELKPFVESERTYVYLDIVVEGLGLNVSWDNNSRTIFISN